MKPDRPQNRHLKPWKPGQSGNPAGRPVGARSKLGEQFLADLYEHWQEHGPDAIREVCEKDPAAYLRVIASILPKDIPKDIRLGVEFRDQLAAFLDDMQDITPKPPIKR